MTDPTGFWTPQCVEAAFRAHASYSSRIGIERALDAALAAKDREAMVLTVARAIAECNGSTLRFDSRQMYWREARAALFALGLLASPDEKEL